MAPVLDDKAPAPIPDLGVSLDNAAFVSYGISGLQRFGAVSRVYDEFLRELQGPQGMKNLREMKDNSAVAGAILFAAEHLLRRVTTNVESADASSQAKEVAEFCRSALFDDLDMSWPEQLSEILTMLPFGWAALEMRFKRRLGIESPPGGNLETRLSPPNVGAGPNYASYGDAGGMGYPTSQWAPSKFTDGRIGFRSLELRAQETLYMWEFDIDSHPIVLQQMAAPDYNIRRIPLAKCLHFRTKANKGNPEGISLLRNGWLDYYYAKNIMVFEGIGIERDLAGYPIIQIEKPDMANGLAVPDIWNKNDAEAVQLLAQLKKMVRSVRRDEQEGMVLPWWAKFELMSTGSRRSFDTNAIISRHDQRIAMSVMADFIMLGHESQGSKALATTKVNLFTSSMSSVMDTICAIITRKAFPLLLKMNAIPQELCPRMTHLDAESVNLADLGAYLGQIAGVPGLEGLFADKGVQTALLEAANLPTSGVGVSSRGGQDEA